MSRYGSASEANGRNIQIEQIHMSEFTLQGSIAALVTPFKTDGTIDYEAYDRLLDMHIANGTAGVVVCGTSGETPTLSEDEDAEMFRHSVQYINHRMVVIAGTGSNSTESCIKYTRNAANAGVDAVLTVGPYYNKPTSNGMYQHFAAVAKAVNIPSSSTMFLVAQVLPSSPMWLCVWLTTSRTLWASRRPQATS